MEEKFIVKETLHIYIYYIYMQFVSETYNRISNVINMAFSLAKIAPLYRQVRQAISNGTTPKTDEMAAKLLHLWLGKKVYEAGSYVYVDANLQ